MPKFPTLSLMFPAALLAVLGSASWLFAADPPAVATLTPTEAAQHPGLVVIDVREPHELTASLGVIEGAVNIPLATALEIGFAGAADKDAPILVVCRSGARSHRAVLRAMEMGYTQVYSLEGGMIAWVEAGRPAGHETAGNISGGHETAVPAASKNDKPLQLVGPPCG